ncbi:SDR family NAD(P)-dependent oxidoreductase [Mesorhizobium sp. M2C.T.Ca.TU.002.02.1.1]|uniref:SDR family NAD(P)-dependent oxidoreductase n=1 Tax=Mesorhizobium sp. M2C.T.Ca.TU.002.02.1.1 TaxID=2496788 RepID=UPI000FCA1C64|nr:SDR family NAD(P)-dependent oxidoreductase [Mesorhizobium sp. M2C.T.Ca.TU.002.02.1.1]RUU54992.1 SDR family oxidoreductase [Mesorhizobium sp. M2C.T.Ca.TU.002.02.1.1]RUU71832.1 SDR family oxidoreductase [Mesorhizobium sp. M2C.T.Ca.TU.009.01.2.1]
MDFKGKTAIVTGAGSGIGATIALDLASRGAHVVVADIDLSSAVDTVTRIASTLGSALAFEVDVADAKSVRKMVNFAVKKFGGLHLAVNNAGIGGPSETTADYPLEDWRKIIDVNLNGVFYGLKYEIAAMLETGEGGAIVNMSSILGSVGRPKACAYVATKHALVGLTKVAAMEFATQNIRVNAIGPAFIDTPLLTRNLEPDVIEGLAELHPAGRLGTPAEVSALTCFLLSNQANFITGSYHLIDGGYTAR